MSELTGTYPSERSLQIEMGSTLSVLLRPMSPADKPQIAEAIRALSSEARRMRFCVEFSEAPEALLNTLSDIDGISHIAWGALEIDAPDGRPIAAVRAIRTEAPSTVEIACSVLDDYQRQGLAHVLLYAVLSDCFALGIETAVAIILATNGKAKHLFLSLGGVLVPLGEIQKLELDVKTALQKLETTSKEPGIPALKAYLRQKPVRQRRRRPHPVAWALARFALRRTKKARGV